MTIKSRGAVAGLASLMVLALASIAATALAQTPGKSLKDQLVGHWKLVSVSVNGTSPYGVNPQGSMFLDAAGHYSVIVVTGGNARTISYFGNYTTDDAESSMTIHIDASSSEHGAGREEKRFLTFSGNELIVANHKSTDPIGGVKLTWLQAN